MMSDMVRTFLTFRASQRYSRNHWGDAACAIRMWVFLSMFGFACVAGVVTEQASADDEAEIDSDAFLSDALDAWRSRQDVVSGGRFVWSIDRTVYPGAITIPGKGPLPKAESNTHARGARFTFEGDKYAYRYFLKSYVENERKPELSATAYDGDTAATYHPARWVDYGEAIVHSETEFREFNNFHIWPFLLAFRPLAERGAGLLEKQLEASEQTVRVDELETIPVHWRVSNSRRVFYLDRTDFLVRRFEQYQTAEDREWLDARLDIASYRTHSDSVFIPDNWALTFFHHDGAIRSTCVCNLEEYSVNKPVSMGEFTLIPFPDGTLVEDERDGTTWWQRPGSERELVSSPDLIPPRRDAQDEGAWNFSSLVILNIVVLVVIFAIFVWFKTKAA